MKSIFEPQIEKYYAYKRKNMYDKIFFGVMGRPRNASQCYGNTMEFLGSIF